MHFGLYLHRHGVISAEQLVLALEQQVKRLTPIGQIALEEGTLSARDILNILLHQKDSPQERFGEVAIEMGLIGRDDLMRLLLIQSDRRPALSEILVHQGVLTPKQALAELAAFRQSQLRSSGDARQTRIRAIAPPAFAAAPADVAV